MNTPDIFKKAWIAEYNRKGIPSSFRTDPSKTVVEFISWLKENEIPLGGAAVDIGCGLGRNSYYLAAQGYAVTGIELLEDNANMINALALAENISVHVIAQDAVSPWPLPVNSLEIAIDVFCYKHIVNKQWQASYRHELARALKLNGYYFISLAAEQDGFYGPLLKQSTSLHEKLIIDPYAHIPSFLYSQEDLVHEFSDLFDVVCIGEKRSVSPMYGIEYPRVIISGVFKKKK